MEIVGTVGAVEVGQGGHIPARHPVQFIEVLLLQPPRELLRQELSVHLVGTEEYQPFRFLDQMFRQPGEGCQLPAAPLKGAFRDTHGGAAVDRQGHAAALLPGNVIQKAAVGKSCIVLVHGGGGVEQDGLAAIPAQLGRDGAEDGKAIAAAEGTAYPLVEQIHHRKDLVQCGDPGNSPPGTDPAAKGVVLLPALGVILQCAPPHGRSGMILRLRLLRLLAQPLEGHINADGELHLQRAGLAVGELSLPDQPLNLRGGLVDHRLIEGGGLSHGDFLVEDQKPPGQSDLVG